MKRIELSYDEIIGEKTLRIFFPQSFLPDSWNVVLAILSETFHLRAENLVLKYRM